MAFRDNRQGQFNYYDRRPYYGWGFQYGNISQGQFYYLAQIPTPYRSTIPSPSVAPFRNPQPKLRCEICDIVARSHKCMEAHKNGKKHQSMLREKASKEQESRHKSTCRVENVSSQATISKHKNFQQNDIGVSSKIPAEGSEGKPKDNTKGDGHGFKRKIGGDTVGKCKKMNNGIKRPMVSSKPDASALSNSAESLVQKPALASPPGPTSPVMAPTGVGGSSMKLKFQHVSASQTQVSEGKEHHEIQNPTAEKNDQPQTISEELHDQTVSNVSTMTGDLRRGLKHKIREDTVGKVKKMNNGIKRPIVSSKPDASALSNSAKSLVQKPALASPPRLAAPIMTSTLIGGSSLKLPFQHVSASQTQESEGKEHHEIQNPTEEKNDQPQSILEELHDQTASDVSTMTGDLRRGLKPKIRGYTVGKVKKMNNGIKRPIVSSKPDASALSNSAKSLVQKPALASPPRPAAPIMTSTLIGGSSSKLAFQHVSASQTQVSEGKEHHEIQNPTAEKNDQPQSISEELHDQTASQTLSASQTQVSEGKEHHEIQNPTAEKNDQPQSISEELYDQTASDVGTVTGYLRRGLKPKIGEDTVGKVKKMNNGIKRPMVSSKPDASVLSNSAKSLVQKPALASPPGPASPVLAPTRVGGSSMKQKFQHVSASQTQVSEGKEHHDIQNPAAEKNDQPQSIAEKLHDQTVSDVSTMTGDLRRGLKRKIREDTVGKVKKMNNRIKRPIVSSKPDASALSNSTKSLVQKSALASPPGPASPVMAPTRVGGSSMKKKFQHVSALKTQVSEGKEHHEIQNPTAEKNDQPKSISEKLHDQTVSDVSTMTGDLRRGLKRMIKEDTVGKVKKINNGIKKPMKSSKPDVGALSNSTESIVLKPALTPPPGPASPIMTSTHIGGSSSKLSFQHVSASQTQVSEGKEHHEIQNPTAEKNYLPQSSSEELRDQTTTDVNTMMEDMNSETAALAIAASPKGPMASQLHAPPPAPGSFEPEKQLVLQTEVLNGKEPHEIQNHNVEIIDLPESTSVELHDPAVSNINTQTENMKSDSSATAIAGPMASQVFIPPQAMGSSFEPQIESQNSIDETNIEDRSLKAEAKADVLPTEKVMACLKCGDEGFSETFVFCNKCQVYALHRYCLDGPVVFYDDVTWFCEDCEPQSILLPSKTSDSANSAKDASQGKSDLTSYEESVKDTNDQQQNNTAKTKAMLSDRHSATSHAQSESINNCEEEEKFNEDCQSVPIVHDPHPTFDPIWRGSWCFSNQSSDAITELFAHLSTLACTEVLEETKLFPEVLSVNLLPRSAVWPTSFFESGPNEWSIGLYFFPSERDERAYDNLVDDMISHDLAIKTSMIKNAELLVFPSTVLPIQLRRFQAKYYLWGVFRAKPPVTSS